MNASLDNAVIWLDIVVTKSSVSCDFFTVVLCYVYIVIVVDLCNC